MLPSVQFLLKRGKLVLFLDYFNFFSVYLGLSIWGSRIHTLQQLQFLNAFNHLLSYLMLKKLTALDIIFGAFENPFSFGTIVYRKSHSLLFNVVECKVVSTATFFLSWNNPEVRGRERKFGKIAKVLIRFVQGCRLVNLKLVKSKRKKLDQYLCFL